MIMMSLDTEILGDRAAVGDPISATVSGVVKYNKDVVIPKGAKFKGRLTQLSRNGSDHIFSFAFDYIEFGGRQGRLTAKLVDLGMPVVDRSPPGVRVSKYLNTEFRIFLGKDGKQLDPPMVYVRGSRLQIAKGLRIILRTEQAR